jgi:hypothetical protein
MSQLTSNRVMKGQFPGSRKYAAMPSTIAVASRMWKCRNRTIQGWFPTGPGSFLRGFLAIGLVEGHSGVPSSGPAAGNSGQCHAAIVLNLPV